MAQLNITADLQRLNALEQEGLLSPPEDKASAKPAASAGELKTLSNVSQADGVNEEEDNDNISQIIIEY